jgi:hypothetical protein
VAGRGGAAATVDPQPQRAMSYATVTATARIPGTMFAITHASKAAEVLQANQEQLKTKVSVALGGVPVQWSDARSPCLKDLRVLTSHLQNLEITRREAILFDQTQATALEGRQGAQLVLMSSYEADVANLVAFFTGHVLPVRLKAESRSEYHRAWRSFVTYCVAFNELPNAFPTTVPLFQGYIAHLMMYQYAPATIIKHISAVIARNRDYGHILLQRGELTRYCESIKKSLIGGVAQRTRFRLFPEHLQKFAQLQCHGDLVLERNVCIAMVGTVGACRKSEIMGADVCDWVEGRDYDSRRGQPLGASLNIRTQKNSLVPKSKKFAYGGAPETCVVLKMRMYMERAALRVQPGCQKWASPQGAGVKCRLCGPLFPSFPFGKPAALGARQGLSKHTVGAAVTDLLERIQADHKHFTSKSMRQGGLSTAKRAGIPKALRMAQSGHRSQAHKVYESDSSSGDEAPGVPRAAPQGGWKLEDLYQFSRQFGL